VRVKVESAKPGRTGKFRLIAEFTVHDRSCAVECVQSKTPKLATGSNISAPDIGGMAYLSKLNFIQIQVVTLG
jgi:hypothetical protein